MGIDGLAHRQTPAEPERTGIPAGTGNTPGEENGRCITSILHLQNSYILLLKV